jgi:hypothetical protein
LDLNFRHITLGTACWLTAIVVGYLATRAELDGQSSSLSELATDVQQWVVGARQTVTAEADIPLFIALDDPIFVAAGDGRYVQTGFVSNVDGTRERDPVEVSETQVVVYNTALAGFPHGYRLEYYTTPMNLDWVVAMLVPEKRRLEIVELVRMEWEKHERVVMDQLKPVFRGSVRRAVSAVEAELPTIIDQHREEFRRLGDRIEAEILLEELVPLVREEIFPVIQEEAQPLAMDIGKSMWNRFSLVSFSWRYLYDVSPLPERNAVRTEFQRFIDQEAVPELESRTDEFIEVTKTIIKRVMKNEQVRSTVRGSLQEVLSDPELQRIVGRIVREATIDNDTLRQELKGYWKSHEARIAIRVASSRLETLVRAIGDLIFGTREKGITPEFSRILRSQVLKKDRRWFVMVPDDSGRLRSSIAITRAKAPMQYPLKFAGQRQSPLTPELPMPEEDQLSTD